MFFKSGKIENFYYFWTIHASIKYFFFFGAFWFLVKIRQRLEICSLTYDESHETFIVC